MVTQAEIRARSRLESLHGAVLDRLDVKAWVAGYTCWQDIADDAADARLQARVDADARRLQGMAR